MQFIPGQPLKLKFVPGDGDGVLTDVVWSPAIFTLSGGDLHAVANDPGADALTVTFTAKNDVGGTVTATLDMTPANPTTIGTIEADA